MRKKRLSDRDPVWFTKAIGDIASLWACEFLQKVHCPTATENRDENWQVNPTLPNWKSVVD
jgi:hypothetical protein